MAKLTTTDVDSLENRTSAINRINTNLAAIETALENTLSRDGTSPNQMTANLDMNSNRVTNLPTPVANSDAATKVYVDNAAIGLLSNVNITGGSMTGLTEITLEEGTPVNNRANAAGSLIAADSDIANGTPHSTYQSIVMNGRSALYTSDPANAYAFENNYVSVLNNDTGVISGTGFRGVGGTNSIVTAHFLNWIESTANISWTMELDSNNNASQPAEGTLDSSYGYALVINSGSTYSPSVGTWITRAAGEGEAPGYMYGIVIDGARDVGIRVKSMEPASYPSIVNNPPPGGVHALETLRSTDSQLRWYVNQDGTMYWGPGSAAQDAGIYYTTTGVMTIDGMWRETKAWTYTQPTAISSSGTITTVDTNMTYRHGGKTITGQVTVFITTNGTGAGYVIVPLPVNNRTLIYQSASGIRLSDKKGLNCLIDSNNLSIFLYDGTYPGQDGETLIVNFTYEAA